MKITEKEIFCYVFFKDTLSRESILEIENNESLVAELEYYFDLKEQLGKKIQVQTKVRLADKIPIYSYNNIIVLEPSISWEVSKSIHMVRYAAATEAKKDSSAVTFTNEEKSYFVRLHKNKDTYKVFVFSTLQDKLENIRLTFYPSNENVLIKDVENPFQISLSKFPDKIDMKLN